MVEDSFSIKFVVWLMGTLPVINIILDYVNSEWLMEFENLMTLKGTLHIICGWNTATAGIDVSENFQCSRSIAVSAVEGGVHVKGIPCMQGIPCASSVYAKTRDGHEMAALFQNKINTLRAIK